MSEDGKTLTMQLHEGSHLLPRHPADSPMPAEFNGGQIAGDEFVCEDARASINRNVNPPKWETRLTLGQG